MIPNASQLQNKSPLSWHPWVKIFFFGVLTNLTLFRTLYASLNSKLIHRMLIQILSINIQCDMYITYIACSYHVIHK